MNLNNGMHSKELFTWLSSLLVYSMETCLAFPSVFHSVSLDRESKDNQWLGVTVKSQGIGGKVVVSAVLFM